VSRPLLTGVVEGFYGRQWDWSVRRAYATFLQTQGLNSYLYCPKGDPFLRKRWREDWPSDQLAELGRLAETYRDAGLYWGVGLSPYALYQDYSESAREALRAKIERINQFDGALLAILFDDMPGDCPSLAERQVQIVLDVREWSSAEQLLVCPTYYSFDPVLERFFGARPAHYWEDLGRELPSEIGVFWTGNAVCSDAITAADVSAISQSLGRPPVLWDNYPVNDGEKACGKLNLAPLSGRSPDLVGELAGHFCNPMNQGLLSRLPLTGLASLHGSDGRPVEDYFDADFLRQLELDLECFQQTGLEGLSESERAELVKKYTVLAEPAAAEIVAWLRGEYAFDPACLTG